MKGRQLKQPRGLTRHLGSLLAAALLLALLAACNENSNKGRGEARATPTACKADRDCRLVNCCCIMRAFRKGQPVCPPTPCDCPQPGVTPTGATCLAGRCEVAWPLPAALGPFVGDVKTRLFHAPGCPRSRCQSCSAHFRTFKDAALKRYQPHKTCVKEQRVLMHVGPKDRATLDKAFKGLGSAGYGVDAAAK